MDNLLIYNNVRAVPQTAKKDIVAGRMKGKTDINPMWRIKVLTEQFGPCGIGWYYKTTNKWIERYDKEAAAFVDIELFIKLDNEWSMPISGTGGSMFVAAEKNGPYVSDECYKMATTDAISVACKQLGIGADVYWDKDNTKYTNTASDEDKANNQAKDSQNKQDGFAKHDELVGVFHQEILRTGKSLKWFLSSSKVTDAKYIKTAELNKYIDSLKKLPDKGAAS
ncbi:MAG: hypothetical protein K0S76_474 [Herbinix sp.]|jgi:hypothetical protein|nr:hypothetical protein [Herbinix sp.]